MMVLTRGGGQEWTSTRSVLGGIPERGKAGGIKGRKEEEGEDQEAEEEDDDDEEVGELVELGMLLLSVVLLHVVALDPLVLLGLVPLVPDVLHVEHGLLLLSVALIHVVALDLLVLVTLVPPAFDVLREGLTHVALFVPLIDHGMLLVSAVQVSVVPG